MIISTGAEVCFRSILSLTILDLPEANILHARRRHLSLSKSLKTALDTGEYWEDQYVANVYQLTMLIRDTAFLM